MEDLQEEIGVEPTDKCYSSIPGMKVPKYAWSQICGNESDGQLKLGETLTEKRAKMEEFNTISYLLNAVSEDLKTLEIMQDSLEDTKKYTLTVNQLIALGM